MKIISPNIIATHLFVIKELQKGVYVYNKQNDKLGRSGLPYGKTALQNAIEDLDKDIAYLDLKITETESLQEGWKESLKIEEEGSERYKEIEDEINNANIIINNCKIDIKEKKNIQEKYKKQLKKISLKNNSDNNLIDSRHIIDYDSIRYSDNGIKHVNKEDYIGVNEAGAGRRVKRVFNKEINKWENESE